MNTNKKTAAWDNMHVKLSTLWIFVMFNMMFADINRCKYFAAKVMKQPANPQTKQRYTAICKPVEVDLSNKNVRVYR